MCGYTQDNGKTCSRRPQVGWWHCKTHMRKSHNREWNRVHGISNLADIAEGIRQFKVNRHDDSRSGLH